MKDKKLVIRENWSYLGQCQFLYTVLNTYSYLVNAAGDAKSPKFFEIHIKFCPKKSKIEIKFLIRLPHSQSGLMGISDRKQSSVR